jgi:hypothetical protein
MQTQTDTDQLGHVFSVQSVLVTGAFGFATFMFGWIAESFGIENAFYFSALLSLGAGIFAFSQKNTLMYVINN